MLLMHWADNKVSQNQRPADRHPVWWKYSTHTTNYTIHCIS